MCRKIRDRSQSLRASLSVGLLFHFTFATWLPLPATVQKRALWKTALLCNLAFVSNWMPRVHTFCSLIGEMMWGKKKKNQFRAVSWCMTALATCSSKHSALNAEWGKNQTGKREEIKRDKSYQSRVTWKREEESGTLCMREGRYAVVKRKRVMWNGASIRVVSDCLYPSGSLGPSSKDLLLTWSTGAFLFVLKKQAALSSLSKFPISPYSSTTSFLFVFLYLGGWKRRLPSQFSVGVGR